MRRTAKGAGRKGKTNAIFVIFFSLCLEPYALSRETGERSKATPPELAKSRPCGEMMP
jgi:hypothetical protein